MSARKDVLVIKTDEAGQPTAIQSLEDSGDTISDDLLSDDVKNAGANATLAINTANAADGKADTAISTANTADGKVNTVINNLSPVSGDIASNTSLVGGVIDNLSPASGDIATNTGNISTNTSLIGGVINNLSPASGDIAGNKSLVEGVINNLSPASGDIATNTGNISTNTGNISTNTSLVEGVIDNLSPASGDIAGNKSLVEGVINNLSPASGDIAGNKSLVEGVINNLSPASGDISTNKSDIAALEGSANFPVTTLNNNVDCTNKTLDRVSFIKGPNGANFVTSGTNLILAGASTGGVFINVGENTSSLETIITDLAGASGTGGGGGGSAVASAIAVGNGSSVIVSGADTPGTQIDAPADNMVLSIDTTAARIKFRKVGRSMIADNAVGAGQIENGSIGSDELATDAALDNIAIGDIALNKLTPIASDNFLGNPNTLGAPVEAVGKSDARRMLGLSAGTAAPPSPDAGDLWYNTTDDELYTYDSGRSHWLGAPNYISLGKTTTTTAGTGHYLYVGHNGTTATTAERGWLVPHDMVITGWRGHTQSTFTDWTFRIDKNSGGTNTTGIVSTGALGAVDTFSDFTLDVDVAAGDILGVAGVTGTVALNNSTVIIKVQRKGA